MAQATAVTHKISRYHLAEESCHVQYVDEMFRTFHLDEVEWLHSLLKRTALALATRRT